MEKGLDSRLLLPTCAEEGGSAGRISLRAFKAEMPRFFGLCFCASVQRVGLLLPFGCVRFPCFESENRFRFKFATVF